MKSVNDYPYERKISNVIVSHIYNTNVECTVCLNTGSVEKNTLGAKKTITMNKLSNEPQWPCLCRRTSRR